MGLKKKLLYCCRDANPSRWGRCHERYHRAIRQLEIDVCHFCLYAIVKACQLQAPYILVLVLNGKIWKAMLVQAVSNCNNSRSSPLIETV